MARRRQQDLEEQQIVAPKASAVQLSFGVTAPKPVESIAFDFRNLSRSLDSLSRRANQDRDRKYEKTAEEARQVFARAQLEGLDDENELFDRWQKHAASLGLTEAATVHGQREIARATGRGKAASVISMVRIKVENALQSEEGVPEDSDTFWKEALKEAGVDLRTLDFYQMEGFGPLSLKARAEFDQSLGEEDVMRDTAFLYAAAQSRVVGYLQGPELTIEGLSEVVGGLSTSENGSLFPINRKPVLMNALKQMQVTLDGDAESFLEIMDLADDLDFGGTRFADDQSGPELADGKTGEAYALQLARMRRQGVQTADKEAVQWQIKSTAQINKAVGSTPEYHQTLNTADDVILTEEEIGILEEEVSGLLANQGLTLGQVAQSMQGWSASMRTLQAGVRSGTAAEIKARRTQQEIEARVIGARLATGDYTPEDVFAMTSVYGAEEVYGTEGIINLRRAAKAAADLQTFTTNPITERIGALLSDVSGFEGLSASEMATLSDESDQTLAEIQSAFQDMVNKSQSLPPAALQLNIENFLKSPIVTDAVELKRKSNEDARIKTADRNVKLVEITGVLNTEALQAMRDDNSLPTLIREKAAAGLILADQKSVVQTWGQFNSFLRELGSLLDIENASKVLDTDIGSLEAVLDRQAADAATRFSTIAREHFTQSLAGNTRTISVVQKEALEFALRSMEKEASQESQRALNAERLGGSKLLEATNNNDLEVAERNTRVKADRSKNRREFDTLFPNLPGASSLTRANESNLRDISNRLFTAAETVYGMEPGSDGWSAAQQELQIQGRAAANDILTSNESGELSNEDGQRLFNIGQVVPGFYSLDDIAETGQIVHRTEGNKALIVKLQAEQMAIEKSFAVSEARRDAAIARNASTIGGRKGRVEAFVDREVFALLQETHQKFIEKQQVAHNKVLAAMKEARDFSGDDVQSASSALEATTDSNLNALTVPWKRSFEELMKYKNEKQVNWPKFLAAIGIVDEDQFLKEQKRIFQ